MANDLDSMISSVTGQPAQSTPASGPATVDLGDISSPNAPAPNAGASSPSQPSQPQSLDSMIAGVTGDTSGNSGGGTTPPSGGFLQGLGESTGLNGVVPAVKAAAQNNEQENNGILDIYHKMIEAHRTGDQKSATTYAQQILGATGSKVLKDAFGPAREAAKMIFIAPINAIQEQTKLNRQVQADAAAGKENPNSMKAVWDRAKQDWKTTSPDAALTDVASGVLGQPGINAIPLIGPTVSGLANNLNEATHAPGGEDMGRILGNTVGTVGAAALGPLLGKAGELLPGAGKAVEGLEAGEAGAGAAQTAADTAKLHDNILNKNREKFQTQLDSSLQDAADKRDAARGKATDNAVETGNTKTAESAEQAHNIGTEQDTQHAAIDTALDNAKREYADQFKQSLQTNSVGAAPPEDLAPKINEGIDNYEKKSHEDFEEGMNGEDGVISKLEGHTEPVIGSPLQTKAAELLKKPTPGDHPLQLGAKNLAGVKLDSNVQKYLQNASKGKVEVEAPGPADEAGNPTTQMVKKPMGDLTADQLVGIRQNLREAATQFQRGDLNRRVLGDMINATDNTLEKMAGAAGDPDVMSQYEQLRKNYKTARANLDTSTADKLRLDSPDKAMGDVNKYLLQGNNAPAKITTIGSMVGDETMQGLRQSYIQQLSEMAPEDAMKALAKIPDATKQAFFGPELDGRLQAAQSLYQKSVAAAEQSSAAAKDSATSAAQEELGRNATQAKYDRQANTAEKQQAMKDIADDYKAATKKATDISRQQNAPYNTKFASAISDGSIGEKLATDKIAVDDINALKGALDPADFTKIQKGVWNRAMADATTAGHFNPVKFIDWYEKIPESARNAMFDADAPAAQDALKGIKDASTLQKLARAGVVTLASPTVAYLVPKLVFSKFFEGAVAYGAGSKSALIGTLVDSIATRPGLLKTMARASSAVKTAGKVAGDIGMKPAVLGPAFGKQVTVDGQPGTQVGIHPDSGKPVIMYHPGDAQ
jgi:hypothetical protein